mmetsp:Transcript_56539/g.132614  ORF Transcript_56539/g.132614 Transcript_56539/m.132614 type:complete len:466 (-) Transcript_56539:134-1531(-)
MAVAEECEGQASNSMTYSWSLKNTFIEVSSTPVAEVEGEAKVTGSKTRASSVPASSTPGATPTRRPAEQPEAIEVSPEKVEDPKGALGESLPFMLPKARTDGNGEEQENADVSEAPAAQCPALANNYLGNLNGHFVNPPMVPAGMQMTAGIPFQSDPWATNFAAPHPAMAPCEEFEHFPGLWAAPNPFDGPAWPCANSWSGGIGYAPTDKAEAERATMLGAEGMMHGWWPHAPQVQMWSPLQGQLWQPGVQMPVNAPVGMELSHIPCFAASGQQWGAIPPPPMEVVPESTCTGFVSHNEQVLKPRRARHLTRAQGALWIVDAKKLSQNYKQAVSPEFRVTFGSGPSKREVVFKLIIVPRTQADGGKKGTGSFKKTRGRGVVQLKCDTVLTDARGPEVTFSIGIGSAEEAAEHHMRGPVSHNFAQYAVCGLDKSEEEWDFQQAVDNTGTFGVSLEITMGCAERRVQ